MNKLQPINKLLEQLNVPKQDLAQLNFCDSDREANIKAWVRALPLTQIQFVSSLLYQALPELSRLKTAPAHRIKLLELLRPATLQAAQGLSQHFLNQPLILPDSAIKNATVTQALQKHLINGYLVAIRDLCIQSSPDKELLTIAIHRAITGLGILLLRYFQLYLPVSPKLWVELHSLFQISLQLDISANAVQDAQHSKNAPSSITTAYVRTLLLACSSPNQLRQEEIIATYEALDILSNLAQLQEPATHTQETLFSVSLKSDKPPLYRSRFSETEAELILELNTSRICAKLNEVATAATTESIDGISLHNELNLSASLTSHLIQSWNSLAQRQFERKQAQGHLEVTVGISNIHYHLAGDTNFTHFLNRVTGTAPTDNIGSIFQKRGTQLKATDPQKGKDDPWDSTFDIAGTALEGSTLSTDNIEFSIRQQEDNEYKEMHPIHKVSLLDTSPGGYCLEWREEIPNQVKAGELVGLREPLRQRWMLGVVRWANQIKGATQLGIQIISAQASPAGLAIIHKTGANSEYLRAFEIPAIRAINQPATLITNAISFREYSKAKVFRRSPIQNDTTKDTQVNVQLLKRFFATGAFSQFTYRELTLATPKESEKEKPNDFDSVWDT